MREFKVGDKLKLKSGRSGWGDASTEVEYSVVNKRGPWSGIRHLGEIPLLTANDWADDFKLVEQPKALKEPKAHNLYTVVHKDDLNDPLLLTTSRAFAREVKATEGGKAAGYIILKYKAVKEIR